MKSTLLLALVAAVLTPFGLTPTASAQELVTTGIVQEVVPSQGTLMVRTDQGNKPMLFKGMQVANVFSVDGQPAQLSDLTPGTKVTVQYAAQGGVWYVSKVMFNAANSPSGGVGQLITPSTSGGIPDSTQNKVRPVTTTNSTSPSGQ